MIPNPSKDDTPRLDTERPSHFIHSGFLRTSQLSIEQGANEKRREVYYRYIERASQFVTQLNANSFRRVCGSATKQSEVLRSFA